MTVAIGPALAWQTRRERYGARGMRGAVARDLIEDDYVGAILADFDNPEGWAESFLRCQDTFYEPTPEADSLGGYYANWYYGGTSRPSSPPAMPPPALRLVDRGPYRPIPVRREMDLPAIEERVAEYGARDFVDHVERYIIRRATPSLDQRINERARKAPVKRDWLVLRPTREDYFDERAEQHIPLAPADVTKDDAVLYTPADIARRIHFLQERDRVENEARARAGRKDMLKRFFLGPDNIGDP